MKRLFTKSLLIFPLFLLFPTFCLAGEFKVTRVYDGDTILVVRDRTDIRKVRLVGIDAPEASTEYGWPEQPYSGEAKEYLADLVLNRTVTITSYDLDVYNRLLAVVIWKGININLVMLRSGLAEVYRGNSPKGLDIEPYWKAEEEAKAAMRGMWTLGDKYVSPKDWRRMQRERSE